jgi:hypothetical protein
MPTASLSIRYRPLHVAFLVRAVVLEDLVQARRSFDSSGTCARVESA